MTAAFGEAAAEEWGAGGEAVDEEAGPDSFPDEIDLGGGIKLVVPPEVFRKMMHSPEITAAVRQRCKAICDAANNGAVVEGAKYTFFVSDNPENIRARGRVKTGNKKAEVDNAAHSTLLKALASVGPTDHGDPRPGEEERGNEEEPGETSPDETSPDEEAAAEEGAAADAAEVAGLAL